MTHVKWLRSITLVDEPFRGWQQEVGYRVRESEDDPGVPVGRILPRSLLVPPGIPDFYTRRRLVQAGRCRLEGRAWSGHGPIERVEVSTDGGTSWADAVLDDWLSEYAWRGWSFEWEAERGEHELCCRATDAAGLTQPTSQVWNHGGFCNNAVQRVAVVVTDAAGGATPPAAALQPFGP
jgi:hypothetical protein